MSEGKDYVVGIDVGSTSIKCSIYNRKGNIIAKTHKEISVNIPRLGHYELDPIQLWNDFKEVFKECYESSINVNDKVHAIGLSVQRNSLLLWDRRTSVPISPIISWQDTRSASSVKSWNDSWRLKILNYSSKLAYFLTGNNRYFAASILNFKSSMVSIRLHDMFKNNPELYQRAKAGEICYGCIETWLLWCLTKGQEFSTDHSCASSTGIYDPFIRKWSDTLLNLLHLPKEILPQVKNTVDKFGMACLDFLEFETSIPIYCIIGDSQAATVGVGCINKGEGKVTMGTGSFLTIHTGDKPHVSMTGLYPVIAHKIDSKISYLVEGYHPSTGSTIEWLKHLDFFKTYEEMENILKTHSRNDLTDNDLFFVPAFMGLQVPINDPSASGLLIGLSPATLKPSIIYSVIEAIPMTIRWILDAAQDETNIQLQTLRVNGNVAKSKWIIQRLSDITGLQIEVCPDEESSCNGAAYLAGIRCGFWQYSDLADMCNICQIYTPDENKYDILNSHFNKWKDACYRSMNWKC